MNIETNLTEDATRVVLVDGSAIQGQSSFRMNGVARTVASAMLMAEELGHRMVVNTGYGADVNVALLVKSVTSATELCVVNSFDLEGKKEWIKNFAVSYHSLKNSDFYAPYEIEKSPKL